MDPNATLDEIRELLKFVHNDAGVTNPARELADKITALDEWLTAGGFLPEAWDVALRGGK